MLNKTTLTKGFRKTANSIIKNTKSNYYRPDLTKGACSRTDDRTLRCPRGSAWSSALPLTPFAIASRSRAGQVEPDQQGAEEGQEVSVRSAVCVAHVYLEDLGVCQEYPSLRATHSCAIVSVLSPVCAHAPARRASVRLRHESVMRDSVGPVNIFF